MNSCLYECGVMHHRLAPAVHRFEYRLFMVYLDLDELEPVARRLWWFSHNRRNLYSFHDADHEPAGAEPLKARVLAFLRANAVAAGPECRVRLLTLPRVLGYVFNPISIYYCFDVQDQPLAAVAEVGNTFGEKKLYVLRREDAGPDGAFHKVLPKEFYVSPFSALTLDFEFQLPPPGADLRVRVDDREGGRKTLLSTLHGRRRELGNGALLACTLKYPLLTLKVIGAIHWQALRLWLKGVPFYRKAENSAQQRGELRPHATLPATK